MNEVSFRGAAAIANTMKHPCGLWLVCWLLSVTPSVSAISNERLFGTAAILTALAVAYQQWLAPRRCPSPKRPAPGSLRGQTILITGATSGLGLASAKQLAEGGAEIILTARTLVKGKAAVDQVREHLASLGLSNDHISYRILNLDDLTSVSESVASWTDIDRVDVLLNNAGVGFAPSRQLTVDGNELTIQSNHLGHFLLTALLADKLADKARIINVSSFAHILAGWIDGGLDFDYLWTAGSGYDKQKSYQQSKLANVLFTGELQRRARAAGKEWLAVSLHPGTLATDFARNVVAPQNETLYYQAVQGQAEWWRNTFVWVVQRVLRDADQGAATQVYAAWADLDESVGGQYLEGCAIQSLGTYATDRRAAERLWKESEERAGIHFLGAARQ